VSVVPLPGRVKGLIKAVPDGELILINEYLSEKDKQEALAHELAHLLHDDLFSDKTVEEIEKS
jgi:Zn-dependent peptidase ImmA (M78 family)